MIYEHKKKFEELEESVTHFLRPHKPKFDLMETLDGFIEEHFD